jgi:hypothetical protein
MDAFDGFLSLEYEAKLFYVETIVEALDTSGIAKHGHSRRRGKF